MEKRSIQFGDDEPIVIDEWPELTYLICQSETPGVWVGHCLEVDAVSQGDGPEDTLVMVMEATAIIMEYDRRQGRDPFDRCAPAECWPPEQLDLWKQRRRELRRLRVVEYRS